MNTGPPILKANASAGLVVPGHVSPSVAWLVIKIANKQNVNHAMGLSVQRMLGSFANI